MKNILNSEILSSFNERRNSFEPYGMTCEKWRPNSMKRYDRHNEIELNFLPSGNITYLFKDKKITITSGQLTLFWGLIPHQIVNYSNDTHWYYVCTIPFALFLKWNLPKSFKDSILNGEVLTDPNINYSQHDIFNLENWFHDLNGGKEENIVTELEIESRLIRMSDNISFESHCTDSPTYMHESNLIEQICIYIARNHDQPIKVSDIAKSVGLHPDYANSIFKKTFGHTLSNHLAIERITNAQRKLLLTNKNILNIAYECGFNSISNFNQTFYKYNGCTPREYRNHYK